MDKSSPLIDAGGPMGLLPPQPAQRGTPANAQDFRELLATQGVSAPKGGVPTPAEAQIEAAQIAGKANVAMGVKRGPVLSGMQQPPQPANIVAPGGERFLPLRQGPSAARIYNGLPQNPMTSSVDELRATTKFGTGRAPGAAMKTSPILNRTSPRGTDPVADRATAQAAEQAAKHVLNATTAPKAVEAYTYGLRAAAESKQNQVPSWFDSAVQNGLDKYDALNKADKKP